MKTPDLLTTDTTFRDGQQARPPYTVEQMVHIYDLMARLGGPNGVAPLAPDLSDHIRALIAARSATQRVTLLASGLTSRSARVRRDAAVDLSRWPNLAVHAGTGVRTRLVAALAGDPALTSVVFDTVSIIA